MDMVEAKQLVDDYVARVEAERFLHGERVDEFLARVRTAQGTYRKRPLRRDGEPAPRPVRKILYAPARLKKVQKKVNSSKYVFTKKQLEIAMKALEKHEQK